MFSNGNYCGMPVKIRQKNPNALKKLLDRRKKSFEIAIGFPASKTKSIEYPDGTPVTMVAAVNNFGSPSQGIPTRPFMSLAKDPTIKMAKPLLKKGLRMIDKGQLSNEKLANMIGVKAVSIFKNTIVKLREPPNSPVTVKLKKSDNPLIDTGLMVNSLTYEIRDKKL